MTDTCDLADKSCEPCQGGIPALSPDRITELRADLHADWTLGEGGTTLIRHLKFKGFAKAVYHANLAAFLADQEGHHPDVAFGWGYCEVTFTTHEAGGLTDSDFICAAKFDRMLTTA